MDKIWVNDLIGHLNQGDIVSTFLVGEKELRQGKRGYYLRLRLLDKTGDVAGNVWNNAQTLSKLFEKGDIIKVKAIVGEYRDQIQLTVNKIRKVGQEEIELSDYLASTNKSIKQMGKELFEVIDTMEDKFLVELLLNIFDDKEFFEKFIKSPAAKGWHHNYIGGLLEHTLSVLKICDFASKLYPVDRDILLSGAILHDIGKVFEYDTGSSIDFTDIGRLVGHICIGDNFVSDKAKQINLFPANLLMKIRHLILSHHGEYEKAAARLPQTIEAMILHFADNLDAQAVGISQLVSAVQSNKAKWTEYDRIHNRYFYLGR